MSAPSFPETVDSKPARLVRHYLAANAALAAFFGAERIRSHSYEEMWARMEAPYMAVIPGKVKEKRLVGSKADVDVSVGIALFLQRQLPPHPSLAKPTAPTCTPSGSGGQLTGTYRYALTVYGADGESWASELTSCAPVGQDVTVTIPALPSGALGYRVWRSKVGGTCCRHLALVERGSTTYVDSLSDTALEDEYAPEEFLAERIAGQVKSVLASMETLHDLITGYQVADFQAAFEDMTDGVSTQRNQRVKTIRATYVAFCDWITRQSEVETQA